MPSTFLGSAGHVTYVVDTLVPQISSTLLWMSPSVMRLMWPFLTFLSQICSGLEPMLKRMDRKPDWYVPLRDGGWGRGGEGAVSATARRQAAAEEGKEGHAPKHFVQGGVLGESERARMSARSAKARILNVNYCF